MNKNQKQIRKIARNSKTGETYKVHREYDKTTDEQHRPTSSSFVTRMIPNGKQPRLSKVAKVGAP